MLVDPFSCVHHPHGVVTAARRFGLHFPRIISDAGLRLAERGAAPQQRRALGDIGNLVGGNTARDHDGYVSLPRSLPFG